MTGQTQGEWTIYRQANESWADTIHIKSKYGNAVADIFPQYPHAEDNARLIAAPKLLAVAVEAELQIAKLLSFLKRNGHMDTIPWFGIQEANNDLRAAIAAAKGEQP
jgi:hypothetical protein